MKTVYMIQPGKLGDLIITTPIAKYYSELGYQVDLIARSLRTGVDNVIGVIIQSIGDPFFAEVVDEIENNAKASKFVLPVVPAECGMLGIK